MLPPPGHLRWTSAHKLAVITAVRLGVITAANARDRYMISTEELTAWEAALDDQGVAGLYAKSLRRRTEAASRHNRKYEKGVLV